VVGIATERELTCLLRAGDLIKRHGDYWVVTQADDRGAVALSVSGPVAMLMGNLFANEWPKPIARTRRQKRMLDAAVAQETLRRMGA